MNCAEAREHLLARSRGTLSPELRAEVEAHLASCAACRREDEEERALSRVLEERLPKRRAPAELRATIEAQLEGAPAPAEKRGTVPNTRRARAARIGAAITATLALAAGWVVFIAKPGAPSAMAAEAVNDHLRVLYSEHPIEIESGGVHQVKPWFEGRVNFAPVVAFGGDEDFPLQGGAIAYFLDRKAAAYVYKRRLHLITLFVYRAEGLPWPVTRSIPLGHVTAREETVRGFHALIWRDGDLGYSLVSDLDVHELETLGGKIAGP